MTLAKAWGCEIPAGVFGHQVPFDRGGCPAQSQQGISKKHKLLKAGLRLS